MTTTTQFDLDRFQEALLEFWPDIPGAFRVKRYAEELLPAYTLDEPQQLQIFIVELAKKVCEQRGTFAGEPVRTYDGMPTEQQAWEEYRSRVRAAVQYARHGEQSKPGRYEEVQRQLAER